ncbi:MAG: hypothetical protein Q8R93_01400, partial [Methylicorpusculum sp.]|nr:hypothetical protein [Methylicorpusculum sp.]
TLTPKRAAASPILINLLSMCNNIHKSDLKSSIYLQINIDYLFQLQTLLPLGDYTLIGYERRQVFDIDIRCVVTEYQAEILQDQHRQRFTAAFPAEVSKAAKYGNGVKVQAVYLSQYQLIPYNRVQEHFQNQFSLPISEGSILVGFLGIVGD